MFCPPPPDIPGCLVLNERFDVSYILIACIEYLLICLSALCRTRFLFDIRHCIDNLCWTSYRKFRYIEISNVFCAPFPGIPVFSMQTLNESFDVWYQNIEIVYIIHFLCLSGSCIELDSRSIYCAGCRIESSDRMKHRTFDLSCRTSFSFRPLASPCICADAEWNLRCLVSNIEIGYVYRSIFFFIGIMSDSNVVFITDENTHLHFLMMMFSPNSFLSLLISSRTLGFSLTRI